MTIVVGVLCEDGVVVGSDSSTTFGPVPNIRTIEQVAKKTSVVAPDIIVSGTGQVGLGQRFESVLARLRADANFSGTSNIEIAKSISRYCIDDFGSTHAPAGQFGALVAFPCRNAFHLCEFATQDLQPEFKTDDMWFASIGSGQLICDPFLAFIKRVLFAHARPRLHEGVFATYWALEQAIELNTGGIQGPPQIATLSRDGDGTFHATLLTPDDLLEHGGNKRGIEDCIRLYRDRLSGRVTVPVITEPPPPPPAPPDDPQQ
jgi:hypothetical protein